MTTAVSELRSAIVSMASANGTIGGFVFYIQAPSSTPYPHIVFQISGSQQDAIDPRSAPSTRISTSDLQVTFTVKTRMVESANDMGHTTIDTWLNAIETVYDGVVASPIANSWSSSTLQRTANRNLLSTENTAAASDTYIVTLSR